MDYDFGQAEKDMIYLCSCAVKSEAPDAGRLGSMDLPGIFKVAEKHMLAATVGTALETAGVRDQQFIIAVASAQRKTAMLDSDRKTVLDALERAGIWYMPLKGIVLKDLYPHFGMREMADNDILFDASRADDVKAVMENLGFITKKFGKNNDDVYIREPVSSFEMHRSLFDDILEKKKYAYYRNVRERLIPDEGRKYSFHFSEDDLYIYLLAHAYKHYARGGFGLRFLLDLYVYLKKKNIHPDYIQQETEKLGIRAFEESGRQLALKLFDGKDLNEEDSKMLRYMLSSGAYGTVRNKADNRVAEKGKLHYLLSRLTIPYPIMLRDYPVLKKAPVLYPAVWIWRLIYKFFSKRRTFMTEVKALFRKQHPAP